MYHLIRYQANCLRFEKDLFKFVYLVNVGLELMNSYLLYK